MVMVLLTSCYFEQDPFNRNKCVACRRSIVSTADVSIIVPVFNRCDLTSAFVRNLTESTPGTYWEAVIVDDGSTDEPADFL
jgi:hypothetical protein